jgi:hypothetical protein
MDVVTDRQQRRGYYMYIREIRMKKKKRGQSDDRKENEDRTRKDETDIS